MNGINHFMTGVAVSSFFGKAVAMAGHQKSWIMLLGGVYGIMADTLDFKVYRFFARDDHEVDPDPLRPDPSCIAAVLGRAIEQAWDEDRLVKVRCHTVRVGTDLWRQYVIKFDAERNEVVVVVNPLVTTSRTPFLGTEPGEERVGRYRLSVPVVETHGRPTVVDALSGPQFGFRRIDGGVLVEFMPSRRTWTHSFFTGLAAAGLAALAASFAAGWGVGWYYGLVAAAAYWSHLVCDLTGHVGASFLWPFRKGRTPGLNWWRADDPDSNLLLNYACLVVTIFNLNRFTWVDPRRMTGHYLQASPLAYFLLALVVPVAAYLLLVKRFGRREPEERESEALAEQAMRDEGSGAPSGEFA